jgi:hypothetical protein
MAKLSPSPWRATPALLLIALATTLYAQPPARFDLVGPNIEVRVTRADKSLPIAFVPNLQPGDKLWLHPDLPATQSVHYLLIAAFLRGTTNPPPDEWFFKIETWNRKVIEEGVNITVPAEAEQAILFLAPETGGDFATLKKAVRGRPGIFVRASQDLSEAGFEQSRIEKYLASMRQVPPADSKALLDHSLLLSRTLNLRPNDECFKRPVDMQFNCLTQSGNQTLLDDGHAQSIISVLSNGSNSDFITAASYTKVAGGGTYSAYVGALVDLVRILGGLHSAQYQYIPAISMPENESLNLRLNTAPSFRNPKSVIVIGLPSIQKAVPPPLRPANPNLIACLLKPQVVLPIEGAPLVFSTNFAHDIVLHLNTTENGKAATHSKDIPLRPDAYQGGFVVAQTPERKPLAMPADHVIAHTKTESPALPAATPTPPTVTGTITGSWGFDTFTGPTLRFQNLPGSNWRLAADDTLIAGRENHVLLASNGNACVESIRLETLTGTTPPSFVDTRWKSAEHANIVDVTLPLKSPDPGDLRIAIQQFGDTTPSVVNAKTFAEPATLTSLEFHAGDTTALATGTNLSQVKSLTLDSLTFNPLEAESTSPTTLTLTTTSPAAKLKPGEKTSASITLRDGRTIVLPLTVAPARPIVTLLSRNMGSTDSTLHLGSEDDLPATQTLTFSLKSTTPFPRTGTIEIATVDQSLHTTLSVAAGTLVLQNSRTLLATFDPRKTFGTSAFGPLHLRAVSPEGVVGAWLPLATVVRLPTLTSLRCPPDPAAPCILTGTDLYLLESISFDESFTNPTPVPEGFVGSSLNLIRSTQLPASRSTSITVYLHLRDNPVPTDSATLPVLHTAITASN